MTNSSVFKAFPTVQSFRYKKISNAKSSCGFGKANKYNGTRTYAYKKVREAKSKEAKKEARRYKKKKNNSLNSFPGNVVDDDNKAKRARNVRDRSDKEDNE